MQRSVGRSLRRSTPGGPVSLRLLVVTAASLWLLALAGPASAQYVTPPPPLGGAPTDVKTQPVVDIPQGEVSERAQVSDSARQSGAPSAGQGLAVTGGDVLSLTAIGVGAIATGALLLHRRRVSAK